MLHNTQGNLPYLNEADEGCQSHLQLSHNNPDEWPCEFSRLAKWIHYNYKEVLWHLTPASLDHIVHLLFQDFQSILSRYFCSEFCFYLSFDGCAGSFAYPGFPPPSQVSCFHLSSCAFLNLDAFPFRYHPLNLRHSFWLWGLLALLHVILKYICGSCSHPCVLNCSRTSWFFVWFGFNIFVPHRWWILICVLIFILSWPGTVPASQDTKIN